MPRSHPASVPPPPAERPKTPNVGGRPGGNGGKASLAVAASEGCIEALAAVGATLERISERRRVIALAHNQLVADEKWLFEEVIPRVQQSVAAAEQVVDLERARARRMRDLRRGVVAVTRIAA